MVPIKQIPANRTNYGAKRSQKIDWIVMHYTANDGDSDESNGKYFQQALDPVASAHYFVDDDSITLSVPEDFVAYHCGAVNYRHPVCRNANSIGVELCDAKRDGKVLVTEKTLANAAELVRMLCKKYGVPTDHIITHFDVTGKLCPAYWVGNDGIAKFRSMVDASDTLEQAKAKIMEKAGLTAATIEYLEAYKWGSDLLKKLAAAMQ